MPELMLVSWFRLEWPDADPVYVDQPGRAGGAFQAKALLREES